MPITHLSEAGLEFIRLFEGAYLSSEVVSSLEKEVAKLVTAPINQNQFDALFSFASNMGVEILSNSKLLQRHFKWFIGLCPIGKTLSKFSTN